MTTEPDTEAHTGHASGRLAPRSSVPEDRGAPARGQGEGAQDTRRRLAQAMADAHDAGRSWEQVGTLFGYSERHARRLAAPLTRRRQRGRGGDDVDPVQAAADIWQLADPSGMLLRVADTFGWICDALRREAIDGDSSAARVGALRSLMKAEAERLSLAVVVGMVPSSPATAVQERRARDMLRGLIDALRTHGVDDAVLDRAWNAATGNDEQGAAEPAAGKKEALLHAA